MMRTLSNFYIGIRGSCWFLAVEEVRCIDSFNIERVAAYFDLGVMAELLVSSWFVCAGNARYV